MFMAKCDVCEEEIDDPCFLVTIRPGWTLKEFDICDDCAGPIEKFLDRNGLIDVVECGEDDDDE